MEEMWSWLGVCCVILIIIETAMTTTWNRWYFNIGIPLMKWRASVPLGTANAPSPADLERIIETQFSRAFMLRELRPNIFGLRARFWGVRVSQYSPLLRGKIFIDSIDRRIVVTGYMNWFIIPFSIWWISGGGFCRAKRMAGSVDGFFIADDASVHDRTPETDRHREVCNERLGGSRQSCRRMTRLSRRLFRMRKRQLPVTWERFHRSAGP